MERTLGDLTGRASALSTSIFLLFCALFPMAVSLLYVKAIVFGLAFSLAVMSAFLKARFEIPIFFIIYCTVLTLFFLVQGVVGLVLWFDSTPLKHTLLYTLWPIGTLVILWTYINIIRDLEPYFLTVTCLAAAIGCASVLAIFIAPDFFQMTSQLFGYKTAFGVSDGVLEVNFIGVNSLCFLFPLAFGFYLRQKTALRLALVFILGFLVVISGRRGLMVLLLMPFVWAGYQLFTPTTHIKKILNLFLLVAVSVYFSFVLFESNIIGYFLSGFDFGGDATRSSSARVTSFWALYELIKDSPVFGHGMGAHAPYIRSSVDKWQYEINYVAMLAHFGIVGYILVSLPVILSIIRYPIMPNQSRIENIPYFLALVGVVISNVTNPYVLRFDGLWMVFLPMILLWRDNMNVATRFDAGLLGGSDEYR